MRAKANTIHRIINNHRRVLPALVLPHLRTAQLGVPLQGRHPSVAITAILSTIIITTITSITSSVSALTYQDSVDVSFTFDPTLSISLSSNNISIDNLVPGNFAHSNTITINVSTNNVYGYTLTAKVGEDGGGTGTSASSDLVDTSSNTQFTSLNPDDRLTLANFSPNTWGYTTSTNISDTTAAYSGLSYDTDTIINKTIGALGNTIGGYTGTGTTNFTIGASASSEQLAGNYTNVISFTAVTNPFYMAIQDMTLTACGVNVGANGNPANIGDNITVYDERDNNTYTIRYINGECWMTQNLRFTEATLYPDTSNVGVDTTLTYYNLDSSDVSYYNHCDSTNGYNYACIKDSGSTTAGVWYNYAAASAGTVTGVNNNTTNKYDICPYGWRLPSGNTISSGRDFTKLVGRITIANWIKPTAGLTAFGAVAGGWYVGGLLQEVQLGFWWSKTPRVQDAEIIASRYLLQYNNDDGRFFGGNTYYGRYRGLFIRCVKSS